MTRPYRRRDFTRYSRYAWPALGAIAGMLAVAIAWLGIHLIGAGVSAMWGE